MANRTLLSSLSRGVLRPCAFCVRNPRLACFLLICVVFLLNAVSAIAQTSQRVYASVPAASTTTSQVVSFTKERQVRCRWLARRWEALSKGDL
jgi:hypothetical protein